MMDLESLFTPYGCVTNLDARRVAVLAPHCDDEVFGCGGTLAALVSQGRIVHVAIASDPPGLDEKIERRNESLRAARILGYAPPRFWGLPDGRLLDSPKLMEYLKNWLDVCRPDILLAPSLWEMHRDHRACAEAAIRAVMDRGSSIRLCMYEVGVPLRPTLLFDITQWMPLKRRAFSCFRTQLARQSYAEQIEALNRFRTYTLDPKVEAAEAFCLVDSDVLPILVAMEKPHHATVALINAQRRIRAVHEEAIHLNRSLEKSRQWNQKLEEDIEELRTHLTESQAKAARLEQEFALHRDQSAHRIAHLEHELATTREALETVLSSKSWRYTRPIRWLARKARAIKWWIPRAREQVRSIFVRFPQSRTAMLLGRLGLKKLYREFTGLVHSKNNVRSAQRLLDHREAWMRRQLLPEPLTSRVIAEELPDLDLSLVIYNSAPWLKGFFSSLCEQNYPLEKIRVLLVDNGSEDDSTALVENFIREHGHAFRDVRLELASSNLGFGRAHNLAMSFGNAPFVLVTNPDLRFTPRAIERVLAIASTDEPRVAAWELRQLPYEHPKHYDPVTWETTWCSHACILLRRQAVADVGGYDPRIFLYGEDVELSYRLRGRGYILRYCPVAAVHHYTYSEPGMIKPAQYLGSITANFFARTRYGTWRDMAAIVPLALGALARSPFSGARRKLVVKLVKDWLRYVPGLLRERKHTVSGIFPFRGFDYELRREGAFCKACLDESSRVDLPRVSIVTRTMAGRERFLLQAAYSVFHQTYPHIEWIIVEDGGKDQEELVKELAALAPINVRYVPLPKVGRAAAGNAGFEAAQGDLMMLLDDDDLLYADHVETLVATLLAHPEAAAAYALSWEVPTEGGLDAPLSEGEYIQQEKHRQPFDENVLHEYNYIPIQAILFRRLLFEQRGGFDTSIDYLEDWNLWQRYAHGNTFIFVEKTTSLYRVPKDARLLAERQKKLDEAYFPVKKRTQSVLKELSEKYNLESTTN